MRSAVASQIRPATRVRWYTPSGIPAPNTMANAMAVTAPAPVAGLPFTMSGESATAGAASGGVHTPPPASGQHTDEILAELGYSAAEITRLREQGTVA